AAPPRRLEVEVGERQRTEVDLVLEVGLEGGDAAAQAASLHLHPELPALPGLRPQQLRIARRKEARVLVEVGETEAGAVLQVAGEAAAEPLAQRRLVGAQQVGAAALVDREYFLLKGLVDALQAPAENQARRIARPEARLHVPGARVLRTDAARERRADARRAGSAARLVLPTLELGTDDQLVAPAPAGNRELDARREVPDFGVGEEAAEVGEERLRALLAVAQVRRELVLADPLRTAEDHVRALATAPVVGRLGLPR